MRAAASTPRPDTSPMTSPTRPPGSGKASNQSPPTDAPSPPEEKWALSATPGVSGRRRGGRARGALGLQPPALAQVVELHERRQDLAPGLAHPEGQHRDGDVLEG